VHASPVHLKESQRRSMCTGGIGKTVETATEAYDAGCHKNRLPFVAFLLLFLRPAKTPVRAVNRWELVGAGAVAFFEGFVKCLHIAWSTA
jgi:hypothetical protein